MTSLTYISVLVLIVVAVAAQGNAEYEKRGSVLEEQVNGRVRRDAAPNKKQSLFDKIMSRAMQIRNKHPSHKHLVTSSRRTSTRRTPHRHHHRHHRRTTTRRYPTRRTYRRPTPKRRPTYRRPTYRRPPPRRTPYRRPTYRRPTSRTRQVVPSRRVPSKSTSSGKKQSLFHRIMNRVQNIRNNHDSHKKVPTKKVTTSSRVPSRRVPSKSTSSTSSKKKSLFHRIMNRVQTIRKTHPSHKQVPTKKVSTSSSSRWSSRKQVERKPTKPIVERIPTQSWSRKTIPIERKPVEEVPTKKWSSRSKPIERKPTKEIRPRILIETVPKALVGVAVGGAVGAGLLSTKVSSELNKVYTGDGEKVMKVLTWNLYEGNTPPGSLKNGRTEICSKLKAIKSTIFGLQGVLNDQIAALRSCFPRYTYTYYRGRGRYDWSLRRYVYNPIFYKMDAKKIKSRASGSISLRNSKNQVISAATYLKVRFTTSGQPKSTNTRNNIKQLWDRIGHIVRNPDKISPNQRSSSSSSSGADTEVLVVNTNIDSKIPSEARKQLETIIKEVERLSRYGSIPVVLMGDLKLKESSVLFKSIMNGKKLRFENTLRNKNSLITQRKVSNNVIDYILESKLNTIFAATISDRLRTTSYKPSSQSPVFAAFKMP